MEQQERQGPGKGVLNTLQRIASIAVQMVETRIQLIAVELEEEKTTLIQLILMAGVTLLFTAFGLMCLIGLIFWSVDPIYRYQALAITTGVLILLAIIGAIWTLKRSRQSTLLGATREQLKKDSKALAGPDNEQK